MKLDTEKLTRAWEKVREKDAADGMVSRGAQRFGSRYEEEIERLRISVAEGSYAPRALAAVVIETESRPRTLHIPAIRDRVVERALMEEISPHVEPGLGPCAFAYRLGLGVRDAVAEVVRQREEGATHVLRTDVDECFPSIGQELALNALAAVVPDEAAIELASLLVTRPVRDSRGAVVRADGLALGCALSPMLANLVLVHLDEALMDAGFFPVRYADDIAVVSTNPQHCQRALAIASESLEEIGMKLGEDKTEVMSFRDGFCFLGEDFGIKYPPMALDKEPPLKRVLYLGRSGTGVHLDHGHLVVEDREDAEVASVPTGHVSRIVAFGSVGFSAGARSWALGAGVDTVFASRSGSYQGTLTSSSSRAKAERLRAQVGLGDGDHRTLALAAAIVQAKIEKQVTVLRRFGRPELRRETAEDVAAMRAHAAQLTGCTSRDEMMGLEGASAAVYFCALGRLFPGELAFETRSRRPPKDVPNAALSYLYTVLLGEAVTALVAAGLEPCLGVLHADDGNRPSLALDLMEEFRPWVVDQVVLHAARCGALTASHARTDTGRPGVLLTKAGKEAILSGYEARMQRVVRGALPGFEGSIRRHLYRQAQRLAGSIIDPERAWTGAAWR